MNDQAQPCAIMFHRIPGLPAPCERMDVYVHFGTTDDLPSFMRARLVFLRTTTPGEAAAMLRDAAQQIEAGDGSMIRHGDNLFPFDYPQP